MQNNLKPHRTWDILDSSKLTSFMKCPRSFFYEYLLGWRNDTSNVHLVFGSAWHAGMEVFEANGLSEESVRHAIGDALEYYHRFFDSAEDELSNGNKNGAALSMGLEEYAEKYRGIEDGELIGHPEIVGTVPVFPDGTVLHFKIDVIREDVKGKYVRDHKTGSRAGAQRDKKWYLSVQMGTYHHAVAAMWPGEVWGIEVNDAIFYKGRRAFNRVQIRKNIGSQQVWLSTVQYFLAELKKNLEVALETDEGAPIMDAFPQRSVACEFLSCAYFDFCVHWPNPLQKCDHPPAGMVEEWWDPSAVREGKEKEQIVDIPVVEEEV